MKSVGIKVLKNKLSEYVRLASAGETILISDRDQVVAELTAPREERSPLMADAMLADAVRQGWLRPPVFSGSDDLPVTKPVMKLEELLVDLDGDRGDR
ncbi:MAG TPA: prevent-host-death protein [Gammaproteobacteria bacterium]|nr:prevent-host-death protein [Gammaproteobacteria bacterium]